MILAEAIPEVHRLSDLLDDALEGVRVAAEKYAEAENVYRKAKASAWMAAPKATVPEREAWVNGKTADERRARDLAEGAKFACAQAVKSRQVQISAVQSLLAAERAEAEFARTSPGRAA